MSARYVIRERRPPRRFYAVDDCGAVIWSPWCGEEMRREDAERVLASYALSTQRRLRIVEVQS